MCTEKTSSVKILSLPSAFVRQVYNFIPPKNFFDIIIRFVGEKHLRFSKQTTTISAMQVAHEIVDLANLLCRRARVVHVLGIPERSEKKVPSIK